MSANIVLIIPRTQAAAVDTDQYTSTGGKTIIDKFTACNTSASPVTLSINIVESGGAAGAANLVLKDKTLQAGETYTFPEIINQVLDVGEKLSTKASTGAVVTMSSSGRLVTT